MNHEHLDARGQDEALETQIASLEMAFRMQFETREAFDLARESTVTRASYGSGRFWITPLSTTARRACSSSADVDATVPVFNSSRS